MTVVGNIGGVDVRLAEWIADSSARYSRRYIPVDPQDERVAGDRPAFTAEDRIKVWRATSWSGGEGYDVWAAENKGYRKSLRVRPTKIGDGLILGPKRGDCSRALGGAFTAEAVGVAGQSGATNALAIVAYKESTNVGFYEWNTTDEDFDLVTSITDTRVRAIAGHSGKVWFHGRDDSGGGNLTIELLGSGTSTIVVGDTTPVPFAWWRGRLFYLSDFGDKLYEVTSPEAASSAITERVDVDLPYQWADFNIDHYQSLAAADVGPVWYIRTPEGIIELWQYNVNADVASRIGAIPVVGAQASRITEAFGFVFAGFRADDADAYVWYQRGGIRGVAGPLRADDVSLSTQPWHRPYVVGVDGDELLIAWAAGLWAYNVTSGGIYHLGLDTDTDKRAFQGAVLDGFVVLGNVDDASDTHARATFYNLGEYTTDTARLDSGMVDFQYPGLDKVLLDVTVETDPLPANTTVQVAVSVDGGSFTTLSGSHSVDGETTKTFTASTNTATLKGKSFEFRVIPSSTSTSATPTIRGLSARATGSAHRLEFVVTVDAGTIDSEGGQQSAAFIDSLNALMGGDVVVFTDPFQSADGEDPDTFDVTVEEVITPQVYSDDSGNQVASIRMVGVALV